MIINIDVTGAVVLGNRMAAPVALFEPPGLPPRPTSAASDTPRSP